MRRCSGSSSRVRLCGPCPCSAPSLRSPRRGRDSRPAFPHIAPNINIAWHVFDRFTHVDEDARLIPGPRHLLARRDPKDLEFRLRLGCVFHD